MHRPHVRSRFEERKWVFIEAAFRFAFTSRMLALKISARFFLSASDFIALLLSVFSEISCVDFKWKFFQHTRESESKRFIIDAVIWCKVCGMRWRETAVLWDYETSFLLHESLFHRNFFTIKVWNIFHLQWCEKTKAEKGLPCYPRAHARYKRLKIWLDSQGREGENRKMWNGNSR